MDAKDLMDQDNERAEAIRLLMAFCLEHNLDYSYTDKAFSVVLPGYEHVPNEVEQNVITGKGRKKFNTDTWGDKTYHEGEEPDPEQPLDEGKPPEPQV